MPTWTFVLIPGAWHSSACWQRVIPLLEAQGHRVIAPELLGMGSDRTPLSQIKLTSWVDQIVGIIQKQSEAVILVGHSRAGIIISEIAQRVPEKIKLLVYLAAFLVPSGETLFGTMAKSERTNMVVSRRPDGTTTILSEKLISVFYNTTASEWAELAPNLISPEPANISQTPLQLTDDRFGRVSRAYIECSHDNAIPLALQHLMQDRLPCQYTITMDTDHSPFFSAPSELVTNLLDLAARK
jgi:pimeloyl-ACP methyl ester carboxylesterase